MTFRRDKKRRHASCWGEGGKSARFVTVIRRLRYERDGAGEAGQYMYEVPGIMVCRGWGVGYTLIIIHDRTRVAVDPRIPTMPGRSSSLFHRPGRHCLHQARGGGNSSAMRIKDDVASRYGHGSVPVVSDVARCYTLY